MNRQKILCSLIIAQLSEKEKSFFAICQKAVSANKLNPSPQKTEEATALTLPAPFFASG